MDGFWNLLRESIIFQGLLVCMFGAAYTYMIVTAQPIPSDFSQLMGIIVGFFFGSKVTTGVKTAQMESMQAQVQLAETQAKLVAAMGGKPAKDC
jgi:hypothetical protein